MQWKRFVSRRGLMLVALTVGLAGTAAFADTDVRTRLRSDFEKAVKGKTVAWVPITLGNPLGDSWTAAMRENFDRWGVKFIVRDPNFDSNVELQAVTSLINEKPDVLIVHNPNVSLLAKEIKRAMDSGIYVIQINMRSNQPSDAYVGVDYYDTGRIIAKDIVAECGGGKSSGKVAIVQGEPTAGGSVDQLKGAMEVFATDKSIKVVSTQAANWDSSKANEVTATVLSSIPTSARPMAFGASCRRERRRRSKRRDSRAKSRSTHRAKAITATAIFSSKVCSTNCCRSGLTCRDNRYPTPSSPCLKAATSREAKS